MGFIGYFVKLIHIPMYVPSVDLLRLILMLFTCSQQQYSSVRLFHSFYQLFTETFRTEVAHDALSCKLPDATCVLYIRGLSLSLLDTIPSPSRSLSDQGLDRCVSTVMMMNASKTLPDHRAPSSAETRHVTPTFDLLLPTEESCSRWGHGWPPPWWQRAPIRT